jgi:hypothetical protein
LDWIALPNPFSIDALDMTKASSISYPEKDMIAIVAFYPEGS